ncbi:inhibitor of nuclear factor kappa-B kinase-interacting protein isoform X1 [Syngnathoides biaculeatus]|uniref:inhibitor of nuclear factor kappa-B kinase-interacting protein isoform X1 n=1 Tax=Syngnathoides biaculeatus TaxID=300417 RepID=UPI002ADE69EC|nr:inhibitor of nuclear factor kappa-B kinase-interacting protein isoform X1 [Syngnathoides biaculeatus]
MPAEVKQRKKKQNDEIVTDSAHKQDGDAKARREQHAGDARKTSSLLDPKCIMCVLSLSVCAALSWTVLQQNARFSQMEEKFTLLYAKTSRLSFVEEQVQKVTQKLAASEEDLRAALSDVSWAGALRRDVAALHVAMGTLQAEDSAASDDLRAVNERFLNVTETWQERLAAAAAELASLKAESREAHAGAAERVNEAERRARSLAEKLEELEDSTRRNARALERAEEDDAKRAQAQLDWNTRRIHKMDENLNRLARQEAELSAQLRDHLPRAKECEEQLPHVEEALRSILKLAVDLGGVERRLEEVTLQVFSAEDSMLKTLDRVVGVRREMDALRARGAVLKMKNELAVVREAVNELAGVLRAGRPIEEEEEEEEVEPDEEWEEPDGTR